MPEPTRVLLADDHPLMRAGVRGMLARADDLDVVGEAADAYEALDLALRLRPDVLLLDVNMPGPAAADVVRHLRGACPETGILILSAYDDDALVRDLTAAGVAGYLLKDEPPDTVLRAVRAVAGGLTWFRGAHVDRIGAGAAPALDDRERQVLRLLVSGATDLQVARELDVSQRSVRRILRELADRVGAHSRAELAARAVALGLVWPPA